MICLMIKTGKNGINKTVVDLDSQRPHCVFHDPVSNREHVVPLSLVIDWRDGIQKPDVECVRAVIADWLYDHDIQ